MKYLLRAHNRTCGAFLLRRHSGVIARRQNSVAAGENGGGGFIAPAASRGARALGVGAWAAACRARTSCTWRGSASARASSYNAAFRARARWHLNNIVVIA